MEKKKKGAPRTAEEWFRRLELLRGPAWFMRDEREIFLSLAYQFTVNRKELCGLIDGAPELGALPCRKYILDSVQEGAVAGWSVLYVALDMDSGRFKMANVAETEDLAAGTCRKEVLRYAEAGLDALESMLLTARVLGYGRNYRDVKFVLPKGSPVREAWAPVEPEDELLSPPPKELHAPQDMKMGEMDALKKPVRLPGART